jgi:Mg2+ and Co2+ transporter CorA
MDVIEIPSLTDVDRAAAKRGPICVLLSPDSELVLGEVARWLGADPELAEHLSGQVHRRPFAHVEDHQIVVVAFATDTVGRQTELRLHVGERGLLVVCPAGEFELVRRAVAPVEGTAGDALAAVLLALAKRSEEVIQRQVEIAIRLDQASFGLVSGALRKEVSRARSQIFGLHQLWSAHRQVLSDDDLLVDALPDSARRMLRRTRAVFDASGTTAAQLYEMLGDTLNHQATIISERLTLLATVFFPLTVSTGFFGMNFGWLTTNITSLGAFLTFGILLPLALVAVTAIVARWLSK